MSEDFTDKLLGKVAEGIYDDGLKPSVSNLGEALGFVFKALAYYPKFWGKILDVKYEDKVARFEIEYKERIDKIKEENRVLPHPSIVGPIAQALEYSIFEDDIRLMFANLLASASDATSAAHPSFVDIIKQLSADEAKIVRYLSVKQHDIVIHVKYHEVPGESAYTYMHKNISSIPSRAACSRPDLGSVYMDNLMRLGLINIPVNWWYSDNSVYQEMERWFEEWRKSGKWKEGWGDGEVSMEKSTVRLTSLGLQFVRTCVSDN